MVHLFVRDGIPPERLAMIGYGEFRPIGDNATVEGRNSNRRVLLVILASEGEHAPGGSLPAIAAAPALPAIAPAQAETLTPATAADADAMAPTLEGGSN